MNLKLENSHQYLNRAQNNLWTTADKTMFYQFVAKYFRNAVTNQLTTFMEEYGLLSKHQFGFCKQQNTKQAATIFVNLIRKNMNTGKMTGAIFVDLSKAFDTESFTNYHLKIWYNRYVKRTIYKLPVQQKAIFLVTHALTK